MNILIESGATKSTCIGYSGTSTFFTYKTKGINVTYASQETINVIFNEIIHQNNIIVTEVENILYYGAGCNNPDNAKKVKRVLGLLFPNAKAAVFSDLYAACHALCTNQKGYVGILGTGSASSLFDGTQIIDMAPSLGYLLGDEGSGTHIGKLFVTAYLKGNIEPEIVIDFEESFKVSKSLVLEKIYQDTKPQIFFASIPIFLQKHLKNSNIQALISNSFQDFFARQIDYYKNKTYPWFFCGSIAYYFQDILIETAQKNGVEIKGVIKECVYKLLHIEKMLFLPPFF